MEAASVSLATIFSSVMLMQYVREAGLISNIDIDIDSIDDTFEVSISVSTILLGQGIKSSIDDTFQPFFDDISISILSQ